MLLKPTLLAALGSGAVAAAVGAFASCSTDERQSGRAKGTELLDQQPPGAIFTTLADGARVNANLYDDREDVYLDGGPGPHGAKAPGLPAGDHFFQVTDPSGKDLLSSDHVSCRRVHVNGAGVIDHVYPGTTYVRSGSSFRAVRCLHQQGFDLRASNDDAITVRLFPYDPAPNDGGVYKVWMTPVSEYAGDPSFVPGKPGARVNGERWQPANVHGFVPARSKTDNFEVKKPGKPCAPQLLTVSKFHDANLNATHDANEPFIEGWGVLVGDPIGAGNHYFTTATLTVSPGTWIVAESVASGIIETASFRDGVRASAWPSASREVPVELSAKCGEHHEVSFGNVARGQIEACKLYDRNGDGMADPDEPRVPGWRFALTGSVMSGASLGPIEVSAGPTGCAMFGALLPGSYTVTELSPPGGSWQAVGPLTQSAVVSSEVVGDELVGTSTSLTFGTRCVGHASFRTKGYWHEKNGLAEIGAADLAHVNGLLPYQMPTSYFGGGDEPFDDPAELAAFLVDPNAKGDRREQLAQQLLAFVLNTRHRLDRPSALVELPSGSFVEAAALIDEAVSSWSSGSDAARTSLAETLDQLNASDALPFVFSLPCNVSYP